jgi:predicted permease
MSESILADLRYAVRALLKRPGFSLLVVLTLGLGIGANTAIFSTVNSLLLRDPPFADPSRLVRITSARGDEAGGPLSVPELDDLLALPVIESAAMYTDQGMYNASGFGTPKELQATITSHNLFRVPGVEPLVGSTFPSTFDRSRNFGLVISHGLWVRKFGRDPNIVGRTMTLDGAPGYTIFGVMPPGFNFPSHSDLFRSSGISGNPESYRRRDERNRFVLARLRPGVSVEQGRAAVDGLAGRLAREFPASNGGLQFRLTPLGEMYTAQVKPYVLLLFGVVLLVLVVACANVANLLLSRAIAGDRETAVRTALGAGRWRIVRGRSGQAAWLSGCRLTGRPVDSGNRCCWRWSCWRHRAAPHGRRLTRLTAPPVPSPIPIADLVVVRGNPMTTAGDIRNVTIVFKEGIGYDSPRLLASVKGVVGVR